MKRDLTIYFLYHRCVAALSSGDPFRAPLKALPEDEELLTQLRRCLGQTYNTQFFLSKIEPTIRDKVQFIENGQNEVMFSFAPEKGFLHWNLTPDFLIMAEFFKIQQMIKDDSLANVYLCIPSHYHQEKRIRLKLCCERVFKCDKIMIVNCPVGLALSVNTVQAPTTSTTAATTATEQIDSQDLFVVLNENGIDINVINIHHLEKDVQQMFSFGTCKISLYDAYFDIANYIIKKYSLRHQNLLSIVHAIKTSLSEINATGSFEIQSDNQLITLTTMDVKTACHSFFQLVSSFLKQHQSRIPKYNKAHFFGSGLFLPNFQTTVVSSLAISSNKIGVTEPNCIQLLINGINQDFSYIPCLPYSFFKVDCSSNNIPSSILQFGVRQKQLSLIFKTSTMYALCRKRRIQCFPDQQGKIDIYEGLSDQVDKNVKMITLSSKQRNQWYEFTIDVNGILLILDEVLGTLIPCFYQSCQFVAHYLSIVDEWCRIFYQSDPFSETKKTIEPERFYLLNGKQQIDHDQITSKDVDRLSILILENQNVKIFPVPTFNKMSYLHHSVHLFEPNEDIPSLILNFDQAPYFFNHLSKRIDTRICLPNYQEIKSQIQKETNANLFKFTDKFRITVSNGESSFELC